MERPRRQPPSTDLREREASKAVLNELWRLVDSPPQSEIVTTSQRMPAEFERLTRATVSNLISGKHKPRPRTVRSFVESCLHIARNRRKPVAAPQDSLQYWVDRHHRAVSGASEVSETGGEDAVWTRLVEHEVWQAVGSGDVDSLGEHATAVARRLVELQREVEPVLAEDPWHDGEFAGRMSERMADLVSSLKDLNLSAAEAALLALAPYACQTDVALRATRMIGVRPADLDTVPRPGEDRAEYLAFLHPEPYRRLVTRAGRATVRSNWPGAVAEIGWWLYHRWIDSRQSTKPVFPALLDDPVIEAAPVRRVLLETLERVLRVVRASPEQLRALDQFELDAGPGDFSMSARSPVVREQLIGLLVKLAHVLAIPLTALSPVVVEHLGIPDPVDLDDLRHTIRRASWSGMALTASCRHPAVLVALREHTAQVEAVVRSASVVANAGTALSSLQALSAVTATADKVVPARNSAGQLLFETPADRFRLDEERVRELLMGENLYRDPALAIRELYQNALDACRLRQARQRCIDREDGTNLTWPARITLLPVTEDEDDGDIHGEDEDRANRALGGRVRGHVVAVMCMVTPSCSCWRDDRQPADRV